ncbi:pseudoazurin [Pseudohoeflea coraliihabitans]|uniref:Pseudoazurin n=1 Tax=Pseudohoeflea coraliihabitans TaxID=2860393 RepID=A0ABS6WS94_9HYPH|nr:pseudoazurin [Pseudohoeflea sp. DP4N28-3]MBW3098292.1 pseudoazurin [Pseudohoeflea sp. DP4N28-3]
MHPIVTRLALAATLTFTIGAVQAAEFEVKMLNKGAAGTMVFEPDLIRAAPGDTVRFIPVDKGHNAETIKGMLPDGAERFKSKFNEDFTVTLDQPGVYGIKCTPHYGMGMVALIIVGDETGNLEAAQGVRQPGKAKGRFADIFARLGEN